MKYGLLMLWLLCSVAQAKAISLLLDWFPNPDHAPLFVAKEQGYFKQEGLTVHFITPSDPDDPAKLVAATKVDIAIDGGIRYILQRKAGLPIIRIATLIDQPLNCLVTLKSSGIDTLDKLNEKTIAGSGDNLLLNEWLQLNHVTQATIVNVHYDLIQALLSKQVDAANGMIRTFELIQLQEMHIPYYAFYPEETGIPSYDQFIFIVNEKNNHAPWVDAFVRALQKGVIYLKAHPEEAWLRFARKNPTLNDTLNHRAWMATLPYFPNDPKAWDAKREARLAQFMEKI